MQIETTLILYFTSATLPKINKMTHNKWWRSCEGSKPYLLLAGLQIGAGTLEISVETFQKN